MTEKNDKKNQKDMKLPLINQNRTNNNNRPNDELGKAFLIIQRELKKKDARIAELEKKIRELTNKLDSLTNNNNFNLSKI